MSIVLIRVDDRLVHGQTIEAWVPYCNANCLIVANDEAAKNRLQKTAIESCASRAITIKVEDIKEAVSDINSKDAGRENVMVIVSSLKDVMRLYSWGLKISSINIGNIHHNGGSMMLSPSVFIDKEDWGFLLKFKELGINIDIRAVPADKPLKIENWNI